MTQSGLHNRIISTLTITVLCLVVVAVSIIHIPTARAVAPVDAISYQGRLLNANGVPVSDTSLEMVFRFFDALAGGNCIWESDDGVGCDVADETQTVALTDGLFSENIGSTDDPAGLSEAYPFAVSDIFGDNTNIYLEIEIAGETLSPRKQIVAAPYALNSQTLDGFDSTELLHTDGGTGTGIFDFSGAVFSDATPFIFEGDAADDFETTFSFTDPTADQTITFQNASGTVAFLTDIAAGASLWETGAFSTYEDDNDVVIGTSGDETITDAAFSLSGNDFFVSGDVGVEGGIFSDAAFNVGSTILTTASLTFVGAGSIVTAGGADVSLLPGGDDINIDDNNIQGTTSTITFTDFVVSNDGLITLTSDGGGTGLTISPSAATTTAIDLTDTDIDNALLVGDNEIEGFAASINFAEFDVSPTTGSITIDDDANAGSVSIDGTVLNINSMTFAGAGTISSAGVGNDVSLLPADQVIINGGSSVDIQDSIVNSTGSVVIADTLAPDADNTRTLGSAGVGWASIFIDNPDDASVVSLSSDGTAETDSGASAIGVFDEFGNATGGNVQDTLDDLDLAITSGGAGAMWTLAGGVVRPTDATNDFAVGGTTAAAAPFGVDESANTVFVGEGSNGNGTITFKASDADTGNLLYTTSDRFSFTGGGMTLGSDTIAGVNAAFTDDGDDFFTTGHIAAQDNMYADSFVAGDASTTYSDGALTTTGATDYSMTIAGGDLTFAQNTAIGDGGDTLALISSDWVVSTTGQLSGIASINADDNQAGFATNINVTGVDAGVHTISFQIDGNVGMSIAATGAGDGTVGARTITVGATAAADVIAIGDANADVSLTDGQWSVSAAGVGAMQSITVLAGGAGLDADSGGALGIGNTNATSVGICNSGTCDTITLGTNADPDTITIGDTANDTTALNGTTIAISSSDWTIGTTGNMAGIGTIDANGLITAVAGASISGATINLNASSNFATNINTGTSSGTLSLGGGSGLIGINSSDWDITTGGIVSGITSIAGDDNQGTLNANINVTGVDAGAHTMTFTIDGLAGISIAGTGNGAGSVGARTIILGSSADADVVTIGDANADVSLTDAQWDIAASGAANFSSIGATTAGSGTFTTLTAAGDITANDAGADNIFLGAAADTVTLTSNSLSLTDDNWSISTAGVAAFGATTLSGALDMGANLITNIGDAATDFVAGGGLTLAGTLTTNGTLTANGTTTLGDNGDTVAINSSDWDITTGGIITGITSIAGDDNQGTLSTNINVTGVDAGVHTMSFNIDGLAGISIAGTGNGAGSVGARTITMGASPDADVLLIGDANADVSLTDTQWNIAASGAANFVSVGATTAGSGTFTTLSASGDFTVNDAGADNIFIGASADIVTLTSNSLSLTDDNWSISAAGVAAFGATTLSGALNMGNNLITNIGDAATDFVAGGGLTIAGTLTTNGTLTANGTVTLGDNGDTVEVNSSDWDITTAGALSGIASIGGDSNAATLGLTIPVSGTDATLHTLSLGVDGTPVLTVAATGNGAGGVGVQTIGIGESGSADIVNVGDGNADVTLTDAQWNIAATGAANFVSIGATTTGSGAFTTLSESTSFTANGASTFNTDADFTMDGTENVTIANGTGTGSNAVNLLNMTMINTDAGALTQRVLAITNALASSAVTESLIYVDNADTLTVNDGLLVNTSGGAIEDGVDVSASSIANAINVGDNIILGTAAAIDFSEFDISASTGSITINDGGDAGFINIESTTLNITDLTFAGAGTISSTGAGTLSLNSATGEVTTGPGDAVMIPAAPTAVNDALTDSPILTLRGTYDSQVGAGITSTTRDAVFTHNITSGLGTPAGQLELNLAGGSTEFFVTDIGDVNGIGSASFGDTTGADLFNFTTANVSAADAMQLNADSLTTVDGFQLSLDALTTGRGIFIERADGAGNYSGGGLLTVSMLDTTSSGNAATFTSSGTGSALFLDKNGNTGTTVNTTTGGALHIDNTSNANYGLTVYSDLGVSTSPLSYFYSDNVGFDDDTMLIQTDVTAAGANSNQDLAGLRVLILDVGNPADNGVNTPGILIDSNDDDLVANDTLQQYAFQVRGDVDGAVNTVFAVDTDGDYGYDGTAYAAASDIAEIYASTEAIAAGEIVVTDTTNVDSVVRSTSAYQSTILGAVSTRPGVLLGASGADGSFTGTPVALNGRVPVFVSDENGVILTGDPITSSSTPGVGMKATEAGAILGFALDEFSGTGTGTISVFINPQFYAGAVISTDGSATLINDETAITSTGSATATTGFSSNTLSLRGSGWNGTTSSDVQMALVTDVTDSSDYRLSIQNTSGTSVAYVSNEGDLALAGRLYPSDRGALQTSKYIYYDGSSGSGGDFMRTNASGWATGSYDFAEMFASSDVLEAGDIVVFGSDNESVARSTSVQSAMLAGIVSTRPGFLAGENKAGQYPIALAGRVPTKVSLENGEIEIGDALTSSSVAGVAMKATDPGMIVGYALEPYSGESETIIAFVNVSYWNGGETPTLPGTDNRASTIVVTQNANNLTALNMNGNIYMSGNNILGVSRISGLGDRWVLEDDGTIISETLIKTAIESYQGERIETTAVTSPDVQITLVGTGTLQDGEAVIRFEDVSPTFNDVTGTTSPIRVIVTPNGPVSLYVYEKNNDGFGVKQINGKDSDVTFDWMVSAYRKDYEPEEIEITDTEEIMEITVVEEIPVESEVREIADTEETASPESADIQPDDSMESTSVDQPAPQSDI